MSMGLPECSIMCAQRMGSSWAATWVVCCDWRSYILAALSAPAPTNFEPSCFGYYSQSRCIIVYIVFRRACLKPTFAQEQFSTGPSCSNIARPLLFPCPSISYILTFLSHDATARWSILGEKCKSETLSSGSSLTATSFDRSPCAFAPDAAGVDPPDPKRPDMLEVLAY